MWRNVIECVSIFQITKFSNFQIKQMAFFVLNSEITIGDYKFSGVHSVKIKRSMHNFADSAVIAIPSIVRITEAASAEATHMVIGTKFKEGDKVTIKLGYNGKLKTEFEGFVKRLDLGMPLQVQCEGYVRKLREMDVNRFFPKTTAKELLGLIAKEIPEIKVVVKEDLKMYNISFANKNGEEIIKVIKEVSKGLLAVFFIKPNVLWCGLTYTPYSRKEDPFELGQIDYRLGYNVVKDNSLKERKIEGEPVQIVFHGTKPDGAKVQKTSQAKNAKNKQKTQISNISEESELLKLADEKQLQTNYAGYDGTINAFLQPFCEPGWKANIVDSRYPARDGIYLVESTEVNFGLQGARRVVEIGPRLGFPGG
jgi:hypothetical protein